MAEIIDLTELELFSIGTVSGPGFTETTAVLEGLKQRVIRGDTVKLRYSPSGKTFILEVEAVVDVVQLQKESFVDGFRDYVLHRRSRTHIEDRLYALEQLLSDIAGIFKTEGQTTLRGKIVNEEGS
jgi:hypothetical protein